ncbi:Haemagluttinin repeat-containing protein [Rhizobium lusitanum]|uniref:Haemagluttinin repeat-containing protein n=1 Tax=Rhizobium lusitanum TaxID=293958 RepID=A0A1C3W927_9HYPH|nr:Haemagluttinin repeat-containing protein [Rhizobium lusitanum]
MSNGRHGLSKKIDQPGRLTRQSLATVLSALLVFQPILANAQSVSAAGSAPLANQPSVGAAPNGVPLVDIVAPNAAGLSHNKYDNFNVGAPGLILNNFNGEVGTSNLGGATPGNPNLNNSNPASVILNEVTSGNRSALNGPTEVFGGKADVIIANPNGITCAGCGFINTPHATLTTGVPNIGADGSLTGFTVNGGDVTFEGAGGNFAAAPGAVDLFDVVSRNIHVNAPIYGKTIRLTGGASQYNYATGEATALTATSGTPEYAIDGSALGAMQADRIKVVVTEKGAGVKMSGDMAANAGELTLSADGKISIGNASGRDGVSITSKRMVTAAKVTSKQKAAVQADQGITLQSVAADSDIVLTSGAGLLSVSGDINSGTTVQMSSGGGIAAGSVTAGNGAAALVATSGDIAIAGAANSTGDLTLTATAGSISAASLLSNQTITLNAGLDIAVAGNVLAQGNVSASGRSVSTGMVVAGINIAATSADPSGNVVLGSAGNLSLTATGGNITTGNLLSAERLNTSATGNMVAGNIQTTGDFTATAASLTSSNITSHGAITVNASTNASGQILGAGNILISGAAIQASAIASGVDFAATNAAGGTLAVGPVGTLDLTATTGNIVVGTLLSAGDLNVRAALLQANTLTGHGNVGVDGGVRVANQLLGAGNITINGNANGVSAGLLASGVDFAATKAAGGNIVVASSGDLRINDSAGAIQAGTILAAGAINSTGQTITADSITGHKNITLSGATAVTGQILGAGNVSVSGPTIAADAIVSGVDIAATDAAGGRIALGPAATGTGNLTLAASGLLSAGTLLSAGNLDASGATITAGNVSSHGDLTLKGASGTTTASGRVDVSGQILGAGNVLISGQSLSAQTVVAGLDFDATNAAGGNIVLGQSGDLTIAVNGALAVPTIQAAGIIDAHAASISANAVTGHKNIALSGATSGVDIDSQVLGGGDISVSGSSIKAGTIVSGVDFDRMAAANGTIVQALSGDLTLASSGSIDARTLLSAGDLSASGATVAANTVTSHGDVTLDGATGTTTASGRVDVSGQILGAGNVLITGQSLSAQTIVSGIDFDATNGADGNIVLGQSGDLTVSVNGAVTAPTIQAAGAIDISGATITADAITGHKDVTLAGATTIDRQILGGGDVNISGPSIKAGTIVSGVDFLGTAAANGNIVQTTSGDVSLTSSGNITVGTLLSADDLSAAGSTISADGVTAHGDVSLDGATNVSGQILGARNVLITGQSLSAQTVVGGIDFDATNAASGNIVLGQAGDLTVSVNGAVAASTLQAAGAIDVKAGNISANTISGHKNIALSGTTAVDGQILGANDVSISGSSIKAGAVVSGVDFARTAAANGNIVQTTSGNVSLTSSGKVDAGTLLSAGDLSAAGSTISADSVTAHGAVTLDGATTVAGQILGAGNVLITGQSLSAQTVVSGIDFAATNAAGGNIVLGQAGDLTVSVSGGAAASSLQAAGNLNASGTSIAADAVTGHKKITLSSTDAGGVDVSGQILGGNDIAISGQSITAGTIVSGVDFARTAAANGNIVQTVSGDVSLISTGDITVGTLLSAGGLTAEGANLKAASLTAHGATDLKASGPGASGRVDISGQVLSAGDLAINANSLNAGLLVSGVDFAATEANGGNIKLASSGDTYLTISGNTTAGTILSAGDVTAKAANLTADSITSHGNVGITGDVDVTSQILAAGDLTLNGASISAPVLISGIDFAATNAAGGNIVLGRTAALNLTASGNIVSQTMLSAGDVAIRAASLKADSLTGHGKVGIIGNVDVNNQILAAGNLTINGGSISAPVLISGIDFAATNAAGGSIVLGSSGGMNLAATAEIATQTLLSAGSIDAQAATIAANAVTAHGDITLAGSSSVNVTGQLLGANDVSISGQTVQVGQAITGVDFAATAQSSNGAIALRASGDLDINAGSATAGTLIVAGNLDVVASVFTAGNITGHGAVSVGSSANPGAVAINGQLLGASNVSITGSGISGNVIVAGVDFAATSQSATGNIVLGQSGDLSLIATSGNVAVNSLMAAGSITANAANNVSSNAVAHGDLTIAAGNAITLTGQSLANRNANLSARSMTIDTLVSGVDFAATNAAAGGSLMLQRSGTMMLAASNGSINANSLLSGGNLAASATQNIGYSSLQSLGNATLTAPGAIAYTSTTRVGGNLTLNTGALDLSGTRGSRIAGGGTLIVNASSANLSGSNLVFGGLALNLSGSADLSNAQVSTVTNAGGSGDIAISAAGLTTNANTALLAAHDLTLSLPSLANTGQLAASNSLTFNVSGDFYNSPSGLVFAGNNANLFVGGILTNDQGAIVANGGLTIQGATAGQRNAAVTNVSGLIQSGGDMSILTANLTNRRSATPSWVTGQLVSSGAVVGTFVLNPAIAGQPFAYLESTDQNMFQLYAGVDPGQFSDYQPLLYSVATLADGTSYHAWTWVSGNGPTEVRPIFDWIKARVPKDANGNPILDPNNPSRYFIVDEVINGGSDASTTYSWDGGANISQSVYEDRFTAPLSAEAVIRAGGNLTIDAKNLTNSYSSIEAGGNATLKGSTLTNEGVALYRTTTLTCSAESACTAYNANGSADPSRNIANGTSIVSSSQVIGGASGNIKAAGALSLAFGAINNSSASGSVSGGAGFAALSNPGNPLSALNGMTAGGALFDVNAALAGVAANGGASVANGLAIADGTTTIGNGPTINGNGLTASGGTSISGNNLSAAVGASVSGNGVTLASGPSISSNTLTAGGAVINPNSLMGKLTAALGNSGNLAQVLQVNGAELASLAKPQSGGVGGTVPGQVFLFETRAAFLDVSKFYGSSYFIDRVGYTPETKVPFLGDAYFDNQLVDEQMRQLVGDGLGAGSFIPGNNATDQMKTLLDNGVAYAEANGLALGQALTPEQAASLTQSMVIYQTQIVDGAQVLVPVVYLSAADKAKVNAGGAVIAGNSVSIDAGSVNNSGAIAAADGMTINATEIKANGGTFLAGGNMNLNATNGITLAAQTMTIGGQNVVNTNAGVSAGGNLQIAAGGTLSSQGAKIAAGGSAQLSGNNVTLAAVKVDNGSQQNATGTRVTASGNLTIAANNDVNIIGSSAKSGGDLNVKASNGAVNIVSIDVARRTDDGYTKTSGTDQQASQLSADGNLQVNANTGVLISGSDLTAKGDVGLTSNGDINVTTSQDQSKSSFGKNASSELTHNGSTITAGGDLVAKSKNDINVIGSTMDADGKLGLQAGKNVTIAEATDSATLDVKSSSKKSGFFGSTKENASGHLETTTAAGSSLSGKDGVTIISGGDTTVSASKVTAGDDTHVADLNVQTGGNLIVTAGKDTETEHDSAKRKGFLRSGSSSYDGYNETTIGSQLSASGDVNLDAGKAAAIVGSKVNADGSLNVSGESVSIIGAQENHQSDSKRKDSGLFVGSGGGFISLYGKNEKQGQQSSTDNVGSQLTAGKDVNLTARATDLNIMGSSVNADRDINLSAARDVNVTPGAESSSQSEQQKKSGFGLALSAGNGGFSIGIGAQSTKDSKAQQSDTNAVSTLVAGRDLNISAGNNVNLQATSASGERDVNLFAKNDINLLSANDVTNYEEVHEKTFAGVTISVTSQIGKAAESIMNSAERLSDSGGVNAVTNTAIAGLGFYEGFKGLKGAYEGLTSADPKVGTGLSFSIGINAGVSHQENSWSSSSSTPVVTNIRAGRSITMEAEKGSITSDGAQILAGYDKNGIPTISGDPLTGDIFLSAANGDINLNAATGTSDSTSSNKSWSAGVGVNFGCTTKNGCAETGIGVNASYGKGGSETSGTSHTNTHVNGTGDVTIVTNDLALKGATVVGNSVAIDVKNLTIESQLDTQKAEADQFNVSGQIGFGNTGASGTVQKAKGDAVLVSEQSGIHAGTGGLNIDVGGQTSLVGGLITSQATADKNSFSTGTLTVADIDTHSTWKAETYGGGIGTGGLTIAPPVKAGEKETGKAYSAIGGNIGITITDPAHQTQDIGTIRRDTENTNTSLPGLPDLQNILRQQYKTQADLQAAQATMAGLVGDIASEFYRQAAEGRDQAGMDYWKEGGAGRVLLHTIGAGILGGVNGWEGALKGAAGAATSALLTPAIADLVKGMLKDSTLSAQDKQTLAALLGESLSALAAGAVGGGEGASYGAAQYQYNYLTHKEREEFARTLAACEESGDPGSPACKHKEELQTLSVNRDKKLSDCVGNSSADCVKARTDLRIAAAEYLDAALAGNGEPDEMSLLDRHMVFLDAWKYADSNDAQNGQDFGDIESTLKSDAAKALLTGSKAQIASIIRDPIMLGAIAWGGWGNAKTIIGDIAGILPDSVAGLPEKYVRVIDNAGNVVIVGPNGEIYRDIAAAQRASIGTDAINTVTIGGKTCVYSCVVDGTTRYVGITDDVARRGAEHLRTKGIRIEQIDGLDNLSRSDARAVEQTLINYYGLGKDGGTLLNKINSISATKNPTTYEQSLIRGKELLDSVDYQWAK